MFPQDIQAKFIVQQLNLSHIITSMRIYPREQQEGITPSKSRFFWDIFYID